LDICPPHLYTVATLRWEIQKVIFQQYYSYSEVKLIDYLKTRHCVDDWLN